MKSVYKKQQKRHRQQPKQKTQKKKNRKNNEKKFILFKPFSLFCVKHTENRITNCIQDNN